MNHIRRPLLTALPLLYAIHAIGEKKTFLIITATIPELLRLNKVNTDIKRVTRVSLLISLVLYIFKS